MPSQGPGQVQPYADTSQRMALLLFGMQNERATDLARITGHGTGTIKRKQCTNTTRTAGGWGSEFLSFLTIDQAHNQLACNLEALEPNRA